jgi:hypothetical protein
VNDANIERVLRTTLTDRAATVTSGPVLGDVAASGRPDPRKPQQVRRWLAPLATAVMVAAVAGIVITYRDMGKHHPATKRTPIVSDQLPIPKGMRAVDALGIEIFVPQSMRVDGPCGENGVNRPLPSPLLQMSCPFIPGLVVTFSQATKPSQAACVATVALDGERGCVTASLGESESGPNGTRQATDLVAVWPRHDVQLSTTRSFDEQAALRIIRSAHAVPIDRDGCAASVDPIQAPQHNDPSQDGGASLVPPKRPARTMGVCWYIAHRLVASGLLNAHDANTVLGGARSATELFSAAPYPGCRVDSTDGVKLITQYANGSRSTTVLYVAACAGRASRSAQYVSTLARLADIPVTLNYRAAR